MGAKVEALTRKTKLQSYYEHDFKSFLAVLKKNQKKLAIDPARRAPAGSTTRRVRGVARQAKALARAYQAD